MRISDLISDVCSSDLALYPMLGCTAQSKLATRLGARCDDKGELLVDDHQRTTVPGLYAAGDLVKALNQMSVGMAHAAIAATTTHKIGRASCRERVCQYV